MQPTSARKVGRLRTAAIARLCGLIDACSFRDFSRLDFRELII